MPRDSPLGVLLRERIRPVSKVLKSQYEFPELMVVESHDAFVEKV